MNGVKAFFDTNVLLYMHGSDPGKRTRAKDLLRECLQNGRALISTQVVQEFYATGSRKLAIPRTELLEATAELLNAPLVLLGAPQIRSAIELEERYQISFWDALN